MKSEESYNQLQLCKTTLMKADSSEKASVYEKMGDIYKALDKGHKALICYQEAYDGGNNRLEFIEKFAQTLSDAGKGEEAVELMTQAIDRTVDPLSKARLNARCAYVSRHIGNYDKGIDMGKRALKIVSKLDSKDPNVIRVKADANTVIGLNQWRLGGINEGMKNFETALELYEGIDDTKGISDVYNHLGIMHSLNGDQEKALEFYKKSRRVKEKARCYINIGIVKQFQGKFYDAENNYKMAIKKGRSEGYKIAIHLAHLNLADLYLEQGNVSKARTWVNMAYKGFMEMDQDPRVALVMETMARVSILEGNLDEAHMNTKRAMEIAVRNRSKNSEARVLATMGQIAMVEEDYEKAKHDLEKVAKMMWEINLVRYVGRCLINLALVNRKLGLEDATKEAARDARRVLEKMGSRVELERMDKLGL